MWDFLVTGWYFWLPVYMVANVERPHVKQYTIMAVALHLIIVSIRRPLTERGFTDPAMWSNIHETTITIAGVVMLCEVLYWLVWRRYNA